MRASLLYVILAIQIAPSLSLPTSGIQARSPKKFFQTQAQDPRDNGDPHKDDPISSSGGNGGSGGGIDETPEPSPKPIPVRPGPKRPLEPLTPGGPFDGSGPVQTKRAFSVSDDFLEEALSPDDDWFEGGGGGDSGSGGGFNGGGSIPDTPDIPPDTPANPVPLPDPIEMPEPTVPAPDTDPGMVHPPHPEPTGGDLIARSNPSLTRDLPLSHNRLFGGLPRPTPVPCDPRICNPFDPPEPTPTLVIPQPTFGPGCPGPLVDCAPPEATPELVIPQPDFGLGCPDPLVDCTVPDALDIQT
ncbi:MAG: hypothetical protein M1825_000650 [Sarcosagium campestre]|nr:MAG: hypothetical protein M1825_000650 [Sarcosagium campestre]